MKSWLTLAVSISLLVLAVMPQLSACSLALHDWKMLLHLQLPVSAPLFPLAEADSVIGKVPENLVERVYWVSEHSFVSRLSLIFLPMLSLWPARLPWLAVSSDDPLFGFARNRRNEGVQPLIIGSDNCRIQVALFADANSDNNCFQLVIMQKNRMRNVFANYSHPWAQELSAQSWFSLVFYQLPIPGRILSLSVYPFSNARLSLYEDHDFVETLLAEKKLLRRPDLVVDPFMFDFPDLPE